MRPGCPCRPFSLQASLAAGLRRPFFTAGFAATSWRTGFFATAFFTAGLAANFLGNRLLGYYFFGCLALLLPSWRRGFSQQPFWRQPFCNRLLGLLPSSLQASWRQPSSLRLLRYCLFQWLGCNFLGTTFFAAGFFATAFSLRLSRAFLAAGFAAAFFAAGLAAAFCGRFRLLLFLLRVKRRLFWRPV